MDLNSKKFEDIYSKPNNAPWTYSEIPAELDDLVKNKTIPSLGKVLKIWCGEGHQSIFLSKAGFDVTAIDRSENAINFAKQNAMAQKAVVDFKVQSYNQLAGSHKGYFDFIFDWRFLHEIKDVNQRKEYIKTIHELLKPNGKYLSVAFSGDSNFMWEWKLRKSPAGIEIYFSTLEDSEEMIKKYLHISDSKLITVPQKPNLNITANYILGEKK